MKLWQFLDLKVHILLQFLSIYNLIFICIIGSGKRALLDVIARRADGSTRGQVLLNNSPLTKTVFQQRCGYVTHSNNFITGLTVAQTLHYTPTVVSYIYFNKK